MLPNPESRTTPSRQLRTRWKHVSATLGLLAAIFSDLRRRAWWAYRTGGDPGRQLPITIIARQRAPGETYAPVLTPDWQRVAGTALPILDAAIVDWDHAQPLPAVWIDVSDRPEIADIPRVLRTEGLAGIDPSLVGTQWLGDLDQQRVILIVTFVEPIACTLALTFDLPAMFPILDSIASCGQLILTWQAIEPSREFASTSHKRRPDLAPGDGIHLNVARPAQLRAILTKWAERTTNDQRPTTNDRRRPTTDD